MKIVMAENDNIENIIKKCINENINDNQWKRNGES